MKSRHGLGLSKFVDSFVGRADMFTRDGLHLSGKSAAVVCGQTLRNSRQWHG